MSLRNTRHTMPPKRGKARVLFRTWPWQSGTRTRTPKTWAPKLPQPAEAGLQLPTAQVHRWLWTSMSALLLSLHLQLQHQWQQIFRTVKTQAEFQWNQQKISHNWHTPNLNLSILFRVSYQRKKEKPTSASHSWPSETCQFHWNIVLSFNNQA